VASRLTHLDSSGNARMVDVTAKSITPREAAAQGTVTMNAQVLELLKSSKIPKGDVLATARIAGIMAAKRVDELIPLCHTLMLQSIEISFQPGADTISIQATVKCNGQTGVEMEALTAVSVAALTIYDMCKALDKAMVIGPISLLRKTGGASGVYQRSEVPR
jgi:cyclic pyranopterin phosphate synthase